MSRKLFTSEYFHYPKQVKFLDLGDTNGKEFWHGGVAINNHIICGCCGTYIPIEEIFSDWEEYGKEKYPNIEAPVIIYDYCADIEGAIIDNNFHLKK